MIPQQTRSRVVILAAMIAMTACCSDVMAGGFLDRLKNKTQAAKQKWRESEQQCRECGKTIHGRKTCTTCLTKRVAKKTQKTARWVKDKKHVVVEHYERAHSEYDRLLETVRDPETQRQLRETLDTVLEVRRQYKRMKWEAHYRPLKLAGRIPVKTTSGWMSLEQAARARIIRKFPALNGTDIADDPASVITALVTTDRDYFIHNMRIVKIGDRHVSVARAVAEATRLPESEARKYGAITEAADAVARTLDTGEGVFAATEKVMVAIQMANGRN